MTDKPKTVLSKLKAYRPLTIASIKPRHEFRRILKNGIFRSIRSAGGRFGQPVRIDARKCVANPIECALCMEACPEGVFVCGPAEPRKPLKTDTLYVLKVGLASFCSRCGLCASACPNNAITVKDRP